MRKEEQDKIQKLLKILNSNDKTKRQEAEHELWERGPAVIGSLLEVLEEGANIRRRLPYVLIGSILCTVLVIIVTAILHKVVPGGVLPRLLGSFYGSVLVYVCGYLFQSKRRSRVSQLLAQFRDVRAVGFLAEALWFNDGQTCKAASDALIELLPRLKESDAPLLTVKQRNCLYRAMGRRSRELTLAILNALEYIGDFDALPQVVYLFSVQDQDLRIAAYEHYPLLQRIFQERQAGQMLLRPSAAPMGSPETLLRAAIPSSGSEPEQLLRAVQGNDGESGV